MGVSWNAASRNCGFPCQIALRSPAPTSNVDKAIDALHGYERISCLLDNDEAGRKATLAIETALGYRVRDASHLYSEYNDLNDYLCRVKSKHSVHQVQPVKQTVPPRRKGAALGM